MEDATDDRGRQAEEESGEHPGRDQQWNGSSELAARSPWHGEAWDERLYCSGAASDRFSGQDGHNRAEHEHDGQEAEVDPPHG
jgi:hypothetical protein